MPSSKKTIAEKGMHIYVRPKGRGPWASTPKVFAGLDDQEVVIKSGTQLRFSELTVRVNSANGNGEWLHAPPRSRIVTYEERGEPGIVVINSWSSDTPFGKKTFGVGAFIPLKDLARVSAEVVKTPS